MMHGRGVEVDIAAGVGAPAELERGAPTPRRPGKAPGRGEAGETRGAQRSRTTCVHVYT